MTTAYPQGSTWRRWDPHLHTPDTILNNQYGDWEEFLAVVEAHPDVKVMGVTDYMSITNYSKLKAFRSADRIQNIELLFPNIEFRISPPTERATAVNLHILVSPDHDGHEDEIRNALARLSWEYNGNLYSCVPEQLIALGRAHNAEARSDQAALAEGVTQFKIDFTKFRDWHRKEQWLQRNSLIAIDAGKDGLSGFRTDGGWAGFRDEITRFGRILFSGRPGEREFWLGEGAAEHQEAVRRLGGARPCLHGSDAHSVEKVFVPIRLPQL